MFKEYFEVAFVLAIVVVVLVRCIIVALFLIYHYRYTECLGVDKYLLLIPEITPTTKLSESNDTLLKRTAIGIKIYRVLFLVMIVFIVLKIVLSKYVA